MSLVGPLCLYEPPHQSQVWFFNFWCLLIVLIFSFLYIFLKYSFIIKVFKKYISYRINQNELEKYISILLLSKNNNFGVPKKMVS